MSGITGELSEQRIFDYVATHLLKQGHAAMGEDGECQYFTPEGDKCAVGCLLTEEEYNKGMENTPVCTLAAKGELPARFLPYLLLLSRLQNTHDFTLAEDRMSAWVEDMVRLARFEGLSADVLNCKGEQP